MARRRIGRRKRVYRGRKRKTVSSRYARPSSLYSIARTHVTFVNLAAGVNFGSYAFRLDMLPNFAEIQALFDSYKIMAIRATFMPMQNSSEQSTGSFLPTMYCVVDYNDATAPTSINELAEYPNVKIRRMDRPVSVYFKPKAQLSGSTEWRPWIASANSGVNHFGLKMAYDVNAVSTIRVFFKFYLKAKGLK